MVDTLRRLIYRMETREKTLQKGLELLAGQICNERQEKAVLERENQELRQELEQQKAPHPKVISRTFKQPITFNSHPNNAVLDPVVTCTSARSNNSTDVEKVADSRMKLHVPQKPSILKRTAGSYIKRDEWTFLEDEFEEYVNGDSDDDDTTIDSSHDSWDDVDEALESYLPEKLKDRQQSPSRAQLVHAGSFKEARATAAHIAGKESTDTRIVDIGPQTSFPPSLTS